MFLTQHTWLVTETPSVSLEAMKKILRMLRHSGTCSFCSFATDTNRVLELQGRGAHGHGDRAERPVRAVLDGRL